MAHKIAYYPEIYTQGKASFRLVLVQNDRGMEIKN